MRWKEKTAMTERRQAERQTMPMEGRIEKGECKEGLKKENV